MNIRSEELAEIARRTIDLIYEMYGAIRTVQISPKEPQVKVEFFKAGNFDLLIDVEENIPIRYLSQRERLAVAAIANRTLQECGVWVYGGEGKNGPTSWNTKLVSLDTHSALLIEKRLIIRDTAESLLREYIAAYDSSALQKESVKPWVERARKVLGK